MSRIGSKEFFDDFFDISGQEARKYLTDFAVPVTMFVVAFVVGPKHKPFFYGAIVGSLAAAAITWFVQARRYRALNAESKAATESAGKLWKIDDRLFVAQQRLAVRSITETIAKNHVKDALGCIAQYFGDDVIRGSVFLKDGEDLYCWTHLGLDEPRVGYPRRYPLVVPGNGKRGVAVAAFHSKKIERCPMKKDKSGKWYGDHPDFIPRGHDSYSPLYRDFVAVPLLLNDLPIGVMCLDSTTKGTFDPKIPGLNDELRRLEDRITASLLIVRPALAR